MTAVRISVAVLAFLPLGGIHVALAESEATALRPRLEVRASSGCVTRDDLLARIVARSPRIQFVDDQADLAVQADITQESASSVVGEIAFVGPGAKASSRRLVTRACAEAADAIALIIAVTLDPPTAPQARAQARAQVVMEVRAPPMATRRRFSTIVAGQAVLGPAPAAMPGVAIYAMAALDRESSIWSPAIILGGTHTWKSDLAQKGGTASFTLDLVTLDACALRVRLFALEARACASGIGGRLLASGSDTNQPASVSLPYFAAGAATILSAAFGSSIELSARFAAVVPLFRDSFEFAPTIFHRVGWLTMAASLGAGVRFR